MLLCLTNVTTAIACFSCVFHAAAHQSQEFRLITTALLTTSSLGARGMRAHSSLCQTLAIHARSPLSIKTFAPPRLRRAFRLKRPTEHIVRRAACTSAALDVSSSVHRLSDGTELELLRHGPSAVQSPPEELDRNLCVQLEAVCCCSCIPAAQWYSCSMEGDTVYVPFGQQQWSTAAAVSARFGPCGVVLAGVLHAILCGARL